MEFKPGHYLITADIYMRDTPASPVIEEFTELLSLLSYIAKHYHTYLPSELEAAIKEDFDDSVDKCLEHLINTNGDGADIVSVYYVESDYKLIPFIV